MSRLSSTTLFGDLDVEVTHDAPIGAATWYGIGGRADILLRVHTSETIATLVKRCHRSGSPFHVLGSGANLLVADEGVGGVVLKLDTPEFKAYEFRETKDGPLLFAMAGADMARLIMDSARRGYDGLSQMAGIPSTIGGALRMNAGGAYGCVGDAVRTVTCITKAGQVVTYPASELRFEYRTTNIPDPVILSATFNLKPADPIAVRQKVKEIFAYKKSTQPLADHSAGCTFKNPIDPETEKRVSAGKLIDEAGLKGLRIGGAEVSRHHANFIVTEAGATASDVLALLEQVRTRVYEHAGIELKTEVVIWRREDEG